VSVAVFEALKRREDANGLIQLDHKPQFSRGDKVCVRDGAFQQCLGLYELTSNERVTVLLELLGRKVRVSLDVELLIAV
jgi:transcriptional antiterminator RfaH